MEWRRAAAKATYAVPVVAGTLILGALTVGPARAIDNWAEPQDIAGTGTYSNVYLMRVAVNDDGSKALAAWYDQSRLWGSWWSEGWLPPEALGGEQESENLDIAMPADGDGTMVVADNRPEEYWEVDWNRWDGTNWSPKTQLRDPDTEYRHSDVATSADGRTVLASYLGGRRLNVSRFTGGAWVHMAGLDAGAVDPARCRSDSQIDVSADGQTAVVACLVQLNDCYADQGRIAAATWSGGTWTGLEWVAPAGPCQSNMELDMTASGNRSYIAYTTNSNDPPQAGEPLVTVQRAMLVERRGDGWRLPRDLGPGRDDEPGPDLAVSPHGSHVAVTWPRRDADSVVLMAAMRSRGKWGPTTAIGDSSFNGLFAMDLAGDEATAVWLVPRGDTGGSGRVVSRVWADGSWSDPVQVGSYTDYSRLAFDLAADGSAGTAVWLRDGRVVASRMARTAKASAVKVRVKPKRGKRAKVKIKWSAPEYAQFHKVRLFKRNGKKLGSWKRTARPKYVTKLRKNRRYRAKIKVFTSNGRGPVAKVRFRT